MERSHEKVNDPSPLGSVAALRSLETPANIENSLDARRGVSHFDESAMRVAAMSPSSLFLLLGFIWTTELGDARATTRNSAPAAGGAVSDTEGSLLIGKCCGQDQLLVDGMCTPLAEENEMNETKPWQPEFIDERSTGDSRKTPPKYLLQIGRPICRSDEHESDVYYYPKGGDRLAILSSGKLRHFIPDASRDFAEPASVLQDFVGGDLESVDAVHYDYPFGHYCIEKAVLTGEKLVATYARVCVPVVTTSWTDTSYFMRHVVDPTFRAISIASYLTVAVVYFVLPQLRDLVGNMITSMSLCLVASQSAATVRIFTEYGNHVSFIIAGKLGVVGNRGLFDTVG